MRELFRAQRVINDRVWRVTGTINDGVMVVEWFCDGRHMHSYNVSLNHTVAWMVGQIDDTFAALSNQAVAG